MYVDASQSHGEKFSNRFPTVFASAQELGIDPRIEGIPASPGAHYHMGGIDVDLDGRSSLAGLWAAGEASCTGVHGANRLASNSLLEGLVFGARVASSIVAADTTPPTLADALDHLPDLVDSRPGSTGDALDGMEAAWMTNSSLSFAGLCGRRVGLIRNADGLSRRPGSHRRDARDWWKTDQPLSGIWSRWHGTSRPRRLHAKKAAAPTYRQDYPDLGEAVRYVFADGELTVDSDSGARRTAESLAAAS